MRRMAIARPPYPIFLPILRQDVRWVGSSPSGHLWRALVGVWGAFGGCLGVPILSAYWTEKGKAAKCFRVSCEPARLAEHRLLLLSCMTLEWGEGRVPFNPDTNSEKREPNDPWLNCFVLLRKRQSAVTQFWKSKWACEWPIEHSLSLISEQHIPAYSKPWLPCPCRHPSSDALGPAFALHSESLLPILSLPLSLVPDPSCLPSLLNYNYAEASSSLW